MGRRATVAILAVAAGVALPNTAQAAQYTVAGFGDGVAACNAVSAQCPTLRSAVAAADGTPEADAIFLPAGDYVLSNGALALNSEMSIVGAGARETAIHALGSNQALTVGNGTTVAMLMVTVRDGNTQGTGGNIFVNAGASLSLTQSRVTNGVAARGAGIANAGSLVLQSSLVDANNAQISGGGVYNSAPDSSAQLTLASSTVALNIGGGIRSEGLASGEVTLLESTIARNTGGGLAFGGQQDASAFGSILANNVGGADCTGATLGGSNNVLGTAGCALAGQVADPGLSAALTNAGGDTDVLTIPATSPAIDYVNPCQYPLDQRGFARTADATGPCDAGAYEQSAFDPDEEPTPTPTPTPTPVGTVPAANPSVTAVPAPAVTAAPVAPAATATPEPTPVAGKTVVAREVEDGVQVKLPGSNQFVAFDATKAIPTGSIIDAKQGKIELTAQTKPGAPPEKATFYAGIFQVTQRSGVTILTLVEPLAPCSKKARAAANKPKSRKLWGDGKGSFRTQGKYSAATIRGTKWLVTDTCAGTTTTVSQGVVTVRDDVRKKNIVLRAPRSYTARPRK